MTKRTTILLSAFAWALLLAGCGESKPSGPSIKSGNVDPNAAPAKVGGAGGGTSKPKGVD
jgi:hypothetical protein